MSVDFGQRKNLHIRTPEGVVFRLAIAGIMTRSLALLIDFFIILGASLLLSYAIMLVFMSAFIFVSPRYGLDLARAFQIILFFLISLGYGIYFEWCAKGQTLGKKLFGLRVMDATGLRLKFSQIVARNLLRPIDLLPALYLVGGISAIMTRYGQRLGDLAANTVVVLIPKTFTVDLEIIQESRYNTLRDSPHLESRLRQKISPQEASIALDAVLRRNEMDPQSRVELFRELAAYFRKIVEMPLETTEVLTDEQYVRNLVASLYRQINTQVAAGNASTVGKPLMEGMGPKKL
jgi:uncharacterized RDD family membrane protein YckC